MHVAVRSKGRVAETLRGDGSQVLHIDQPGGGCPAQLQRPETGAHLLCQVPPA